MKKITLLIMMLIAIGSTSVVRTETQNTDRIGTCTNVKSGESFTYSTRKVTDIRLTMAGGLSSFTVIDTDGIVRDVFLHDKHFSCKRPN